MYTLGHDVHFGFGESKMRNASNEEPQKDEGQRNGPGAVSVDEAMMGTCTAIWFNEL
jgi:hypothetical protein